MPPGLLNPAMKDYEFPRRPPATREFDLAPLIRLLWDWKTVLDPELLFLPANPYSHFSVNELTRQSILYGLHADYQTNHVKTSGKTYKAAPGMYKIGGR